MKAFGIILLVIGLGMAIWSAVTFAQRPSTKAKAQELKEDIRDKAQDVKEDVGAAKDNVVQEVEESKAEGKAPWPAWVGVGILVIGIILIAAFSRRKKVVVTETTVTTNRT